MTSLTELVEVVIGVDTHVDTHTAAAVHAGTGGVLAEITVEATAAGYAELVAFAGQHSGLRAWAIEGTGIHGAGLARHLEQAGEVVIELDRPERPHRRNGAKSDSLDAVRAAREALSRTRLGTPRATLTVHATSLREAGARRACCDDSCRLGRIHWDGLHHGEHVSSPLMRAGCNALMRTPNRLIASEGVGGV